MINASPFIVLERGRRLAHRAASDAFAGFRRGARIYRDPDGVERARDEAMSAWAWHGPVTIETPRGVAVLRDWPGQWEATP